MNKRIEELAEQAGFKHPDHVGLCEEYAYFDHKKFAELILKQCLKYVDDSFGDVDYVKFIIKRDFGVE